MYFLNWLLKRLHRNLFGGRWNWVDEYRSTIIREKPLAILITIGLGLIWFMVSVMIIILGFYGGHAQDAPAELIWSVGLLPFVVFLYNWIMALYDIYDAERMATWETLKNKNL